MNRPLTLALCTLILVVAPPASADSLPEVVSFCGETFPTNITQVICSNTAFNLSYTKVSDVSPLAKLTNLTLLDLRDTKVSASQIESLMEKLTCDIYHDY